MMCRPAGVSDAFRHRSLFSLSAVCLPSVSQMKTSGGFNTLSFLLCSSKNAGKNTLKKPGQNIPSLVESGPRGRPSYPENTKDRHQENILPPAFGTGCHLLHYRTKPTAEKHQEKTHIPRCGESNHNPDAVEETPRASESHFQRYSWKRPREAGKRLLQRTSAQHTEEGAGRKST